MNLRFNRDWTWIIVKWISVGFNSLSTWKVFYAALSVDTDRTISILGTVAAILLIDYLFIALVNFVEGSGATKDMPYHHRTPYAYGLVLLYVSIVLIGVYDSGWLAIAPRVGLGIITFVVYYQYWMHSKLEKEALWEEEFEREKNKAERKDAFDLQKESRKLKTNQRKAALKAIKKEIELKYREDYRKQLGLLKEGTSVATGHAEEGTSPAKFGFIEDSSIGKYDHPVISSPILSDDSMAWENDDKTIYFNRNTDRFGYFCPYCNATSEQTSKGKVYTRRTAQLALNRHMCDQKREAING